MTTKQNCQELIDRLSDKTLGFGDYVQIEQKRHGCPNEMYTYKVIASCRSNCSVPVPVEAPEKDLGHDGMEEVIRAVRCGVAEEEVRNFKVKDVKFAGKPIFLHDVLAKILVNVDYQVGSSEEPGSLEATKLLMLWQYCGLTRSLQDIYESTEWEDDECFGEDCVCRGQCHEFAAPKDPNVRNLFQFLINLNLTKWTN